MFEVRYYLRGLRVCVGWLPIKRPRGHGDRADGGRAVAKKRGRPPGVENFITREIKVAAINAAIRYGVAAPTGARCTVGPSQISIAPAEPGAPLPALSFPGGFRTGASTTAHWSPI